MGIPPTRYQSYPHEFSGGMRQRLMIALALVLRPAFVVADEPTTALDVLVEAQIIQILNDLRRNFDTSLLLITHNLGIVAEACDRVAVMYAGRIVEQGDVRDVFGNPQHPYTRELLRSTISLKTTGLNFIPGAPPDLVDPPAGCRFHPRCPSAMQVCVAEGPGADGLGDRHRGGVLADRAGGPDPRGWHRASRAGGDQRCRRSLRPSAAAETLVDIQRPVGALRPGRQHRRPAARSLDRHGQGGRRHQPDRRRRRGRRPGRRERQRQVDAGPRPCSAWLRRRRG